MYSRLFLSKREIGKAGNGRPEFLNPRWSAGNGGNFKNQNFGKGTQDEIFAGALSSKGDLKDACFVPPQDKFWEEMKMS